MSKLERYKGPQPMAPNRNGDWVAFSDAFSEIRNLKDNIYFFVHEFERSDKKLSDVRDLCRKLKKISK